MLSKVEIKLLIKQETSLDDNKAIMKIDCLKLINSLKNESGRVVISTKEEQEILQQYSIVSRRQAIILGLANIKNYYHRQAYYCANASQENHFDQVLLDQESIYQLWEIHEKSGKTPIYPWEYQDKVNQRAYFKLAESSAHAKSCFYTILEDLQYELFFNQPSPILAKLATYVATQQDSQTIIANIKQLQNVLSRCQDIAELSVFLLREELDHEFKKCQAVYYEESNPAIIDYTKNCCTLLETLCQDPTLKKSKFIDILNEPKYRQHLNNWNTYTQKQGKPLLVALLYLYLFIDAKSPQDRVTVQQRKQWVMGNFFKALLAQQKLCHHYRRQTRDSHKANKYSSSCVINGERHNWDAKTHAYIKGDYL